MDCLQTLTQQSVGQDLQEDQIKLYIDLEMTLPQDQITKLSYHWL